MNEEIRQLIEEYTIDDFERMAMETDYAIDANEDTCKINEADAGAFYQEGMKHGINLILSKWQEANRWRKVEEELPENNENLILKKESELTTQPVLIKTVGGRLSVDYRVKTIHENLDGWVEFWNWTRFNNNQVTEWKPIE